MWDVVGHDVVKRLGKVVSCAVAIGFGLALLAVTFDGSMAQAGDREIRLKCGRLPLKSGDLECMKYAEVIKVVRETITHRND